MSKKYIAKDRLGNEYDVSSNPDFIRGVTWKGNLDNLHWAVNDFYTKFDEGKINKENATKFLIKSCEEFIQGSEREEELPTFQVTQVAKVKYTWIVQAKNKEEAEDKAMTSEADNEESIETLDLVVYDEEELK
jgi:hypothetical protein